ncbi:DUF2237 family protein [Leptolyngbya sp. 7M]|uniref:DUF2237 family protein n=1 Tax=Leptolyngbya sp. 7M TaxID=2812896 RepID=UPI001B8D10FF|nr:DUF2237 domain-containing protein [Leptolyngbya sp. 7M]QYO63182.1 DUF2237 domain-containing protein [Leptolyngbya sp. 7M]
MAKPMNVLGGELASCCTSPITGFYRNGYCETGADDRGVHVVCAQMTEAFLTFTTSQGNDLSTPAPMFGFPGLSAAPTQGFHPCTPFRSYKGLL